MPSCKAALKTKLFYRQKIKWHGFAINRFIMNIMKRRKSLRSLLKKNLFDFVFPAFLAWAFSHFVARALEFTSIIEAVTYFLIALACVISGFISVCPRKAKQIGSENLRRFACRFFPGSRFARPPLSYTRARQLVAEKKYDEAIAVFQEILRHYPEEKEPYNQIIWIANLSGQTVPAEKFSRNFHVATR